MALVAEKVPNLTHSTPTPPLREVGPTENRFSWAYVVAASIGLLLLDVFGGASYAGGATLLTVALFATIGVTSPDQRQGLLHSRMDRLDLFLIGVVFVAVVALYRFAFVVIKGSDLLLFVFFAGGLLVGAGAPVVYTVWGRRRSLASLGLSTAQLPRVAAIALVFAAVQFSITFWGYGDFPRPKDVLTLLGMALMVGIFETIFFRGFVQGRLTASFGTAPAVFGAAFLYGIYHVGYGMDLNATVFLGGLGIVYALAYATTNNFFLMWPLLTPLGSLFAQLDDGELVGRLPWASLLGFADVMALIATLLWFAHKHEKKLQRAQVEINDLQMRDRLPKKE